MSLVRTSSLGLVALIMVGCGGLLDLDDKTYDPALDPTSAGPGGASSSQGGAGTGGATAGSSAGGASSGTSGHGGESGTAGSAGTAGQAGAGGAGGGGASAGQSGAAGAAGQSGEAGAAGEAGQGGAMSGSSGQGGEAGAAGAGGDAGQGGAGAAGEGGAGEGGAGEGGAGQSGAGQSGAGQSGAGQGGAGSAGSSGASGQAGAGQGGASGAGQGGGSGAGQGGTSPVGDGSILIVANYDGGKLTLDIDKDYGDLRIGLISYKPLDVTITGAFASTVSAVRVVGFSAVSTQVSAVSPLMVTKVAYNPQGDNLSCQYRPGPDYSGSSCNTREQVAEYFTKTLGGQVVVHDCQYEAYGTTIKASSPSTCIPVGCVPKTCADLGNECGVHDNGCGSTITCCTFCGTGQLEAGPLSPSTIVGDAGIGTRAWGSLSDAATSDDKYAQALALTVGETSHWLKATNFGFALPASAVVKSMWARVERSTYGDATIKDASAGFVKASTITSKNYANGDFWQKGAKATPPMPDQVVTYGGLISGTWTSGNINSAGFGFALAARYLPGSGNDSAFVDSIRMYVCYE